MAATRVILFYCYADIDAEEQAQRQRELCTAGSLLGRVLISPDGINGTLGGTPASIQAYIDSVCNTGPFPMTPADFKDSFMKEDDPEPFPDLQIKVVKEIVSSGGAFASISNEEAGKGYLAPHDFHTALESDDAIVLDVRNHKEFQIGHFDKAVDPNTRTFAQWPQYMQEHIEEIKGKKVLMYCTGGIRCEKASAYVRRLLKEAGDDSTAEQVYHLKGGIHRYLEAFPDGGHFKGSNFVFDRRYKMGPSQSTLVGECAACKAAHDQFSHNIVCTVCRDPVLICAGCKESLREFHCETHRDLGGCYFTNLAPFSKEQLQQQEADLQAMMDAIRVGKSFKNKRRSLARQLERVRHELKRDGARAPLEEMACRSCGRTSCDGSCWGFHGTQRVATLQHKENEEVMQAIPPAALEGGETMTLEATDVALQRGQEYMTVQLGKFARRSGGTFTFDHTRGCGEVVVPSSKEALSALTALRSSGFVVGTPACLPTSKKHAKRLAKRRRNHDADVKAAKKARREQDHSRRTSPACESYRCERRRRHAEADKKAKIFVLRVPDCDRAVRVVEPYVHEFECAVKARWAGMTVIDMLSREFGSLPAEYYKKAVEAGCVMVNDTAVSPTHTLLMGEVVRHVMIRREPPVWIEPEDNITVKEEGSLLIVNKPPGMPVHACGAYRHNTVIAALAAQGYVNLHVAHRLDRLTSGLLLLAKTADAAKTLSSQLHGEARGRKLYLARVQGSFPTETSCTEPILTIDAKQGRRTCDSTGKPAHTSFRLVKHCADGTSLVACYPTTGRTHQIRCHLQFLGHPIANDPLYARATVKDACVTADQFARAEEAKDKFEKNAVATLCCEDEEALPSLEDMRRIDPGQDGGQSVLFTPEQLRTRLIWLHSVAYTPVEGGTRYTVELPDWADGASLDSITLHTSE